MTTLAGALATRCVHAGELNPPIYLDYNATTPVAPEVADAMLPYLREHFGNPSSAHPYGRRAQEAVARARGQVAALIGTQAGELVFTGCATEANNLAILGVARALHASGRHMIASAVEHPAVARPMAHLRDRPSRPAWSNFRGCPWGSPSPAPTRAPRDSAGAAFWR
jgi:selenocysteine lyase/cysteine desulfurase